MWKRIIIGALFIASAWVGLAQSEEVVCGPSRCEIKCGPNVCRGTSGNDAISGTGGFDMILAGSGHDQLRGKRTLDYMYGEKGDDRLWGGKGNDRLEGGPGQDRLIGGPGADLYDFGIDQRWGRDTIEDDPVRPPRLQGEQGALFDGNRDLIIDLRAGKGPEVRVVGGSARVNWTRNVIGFVIGGVGNDLITGRTAADKIYGGGGRDRIESRGGDDRVITDEYPTRPNDSVSCGPGDDVAIVSRRDTVEADCERVRRVRSRT